MGYVPDVMRKKVYDTNENQKVDSAEDADTVDGIQGSEILKKDGSVPMTGDLDLGTHNITNWNGDIAGPYSGILKYCDSDGYKLIENRNDTYSNVGFRARSIKSGYDMQIYYVIYKAAPTFATELMWGVQEDSTFKVLHLNILGEFFPHDDNDIKLGISSKRWSHIYATNGHLDVLETDTINEKTIDSGVTIDGCLIKDGKAEQAISVTGIVKQRLTINAGESFTISSGECMTVILPPGEEFTINGSLTIQDGGRFILFGL